ncbi:hypothetical protein B296_00041006 [Ensete ventricosum]|uniref:Uncharacterized protein n=1 Tax=Ensete ventricosum TaxID=4639 RepID=A0A426YZC4_ENSVE|nr:hypothetical protein B296_00041006 [Ensete ventricosum]
MGNRFCFDFYCECDATAEVSQYWYQSQGVARHLQRGERLWPRPPAKGRPTAASPQGQQPPRARPFAMSTRRSGQPARGSRQRLAHKGLTPTGQQR